MRIAVTDACIFIDLIELDLISHFFQLDIELHTTVEVINELFLEQRQVLEAFQQGGKLNVHTLEDSDFKNTDNLNFSKGLSPEDRSVLYIALSLENAIVISSDNLVRKSAVRYKLECHGLLWVVDELVSQTVCTKPSATSALKMLISSNKMYASGKLRKEIEERFLKWG